MTRMKTFGAVIILSAAAAGPALAWDSGIGVPSRGDWGPPPPPYYYRSCIQGPGYEPCPGLLYGWSVGRDRSRVGGYAPSFRPAGN
jgi:hypothetical protein